MNRVSIVCFISLFSLASAGIPLSCASPSFSGVCVIGSAASPVQSTGGGWHTNIVTTRFGCSTDAGVMASGVSTNAVALYAALPTRKALHKKIEVRVSSGKTIVIPVLDVGPWNTKDAAYVFSEGRLRPAAESGVGSSGDVNAGRKTNRAGLDISCQAANALGIGGKGMADWRFVT